MTTRRWTLLLLLALGAALAVVVPGVGSPAAALGRQAPEPAEVTEPGADVTVGADEPDVDRGEAAEPESRPLFTESRRIVAIIGGLVLVALALLLLTIRYWRVTKPIPAAAVPERSEATAVPARGAVPEEFVVAPITSEVPVSVAAADHRPDDTWEPRGTGEHAAVTIAAQRAAARPKPAIARPGRDARQAALARTANGSSGR